MLPWYENKAGTYIHTINTYFTCETLYFDYKFLYKSHELKYFLCGVLPLEQKSRSPPSRSWVTVQTIMGSRLTSKISFPNRWKKRKKVFFQEKMKKGQKISILTWVGLTFHLFVFKRRVNIWFLWGPLITTDLLNNDCSNFNVQIDLPNIIQTDVTNVCSRISAVQPKSIIQHRVIFVLVVIYL